jgi:transmembrane sensor
MAREHEEMTSLTDQAAHWWCLLQEGDAPASEKREFATWVLQSPERIEAVLRIAQVSKALSKARMPDTPVEVLIREAAAAPEENVFPLRRRETPVAQPRRGSVMRIAAGLAAVVLLALGASWFTLMRGERFETRLGEQRLVALADGSRVTLNTASSIEVRLREDRRVVELVAGEALFEVAHDAHRPFEVRVGNVVVKAVGTQFDVDRREIRTAVTVTEGRVAVTVAGARDTQLPILSSGERIVIEGGGAPSIEKGIDRAEATAWTQRQLVLQRRASGDSQPLPARSQSDGHISYRRLGLFRGSARGHAGGPCI